MNNTSAEAGKVWSDCLKMIAGIVGVQAFDSWFAPLIPYSLEDNVLTLVTPSAFHNEVLEQLYVDVLKEVIHKTLGPKGRLRYRYPVELNSDPKKSKYLTEPSSYRPAISNPSTLPPVDVYNKSNNEIPDPFVLPGIQRMKIPSNLIDSMTFDNYVEGDCNRMARAAGWAISKDPGTTSFNPLFVYSDVGLGKTHLANAIGIQTKINYPEKIVVYVTADTFCSQYVQAVKNNNIQDFIYFYQSLDMLIMDDIQFMSGGKAKTQDTFFQIFNSLHRENKQIIITSDKSPVDISGFEPRLLSRFKWGLTIDLQVPDLETRHAIIRKKLENDGIEFPDEIVDYLALRITSNTRELEGAIIAILAQASLNHREITMDLAKEMVDKYVKSNAKEISIEYIQKIVGDYYNISVETINAKTRKSEIVLARQLCMYFAKKYTKLPLSTIGTYCGNKDHATVLHACKTIANLYDTDKKMRASIDDIDKKMKL
ncbi:MAG: chromosomal replication initiator protein DnaA [Bacteroidales bacterium]|nr:chromosomal replication initiator protein DnaA [Bacteroidales bacterium]